MARLARADINKVSYIGEPVSGSAMFLSAKAGSLLHFLDGVEDCLVFAENGLEVPEELLQKHYFEFSNNPQLAYYYFTSRLAELRSREEQEKPYRSYGNPADHILIGQGVCLGEDVKLAPGVLIDHGCRIGKGVRIGAFSIVRHSTLGDGVTVGDQTVIGADGYNLVEDADGRLKPMATLGRVELASGVVVGSHCVIAAGLAGTTRIGCDSQIDSFCHIHHDCQIGRAVELASSVKLGGFVKIDDKAFLGIGCKIKNRISIGSEALVGMGSVVVKNITAADKVYGVPARKHD